MKYLTNILFTLFCLALAALHYFLKLDILTMSILFLGLLPWFKGIFHTIELNSTGIKITYQDLKTVGSDLKNSGLLKSKKPIQASKQKPLYYEGDNSRDAFLLLRVDLERKLNTLAIKYGIKNKQSASALIRNLFKVKVFNQDEINSLNKFLEITNKAIHNIEQDPQILDWVNTTGYQILAGLDERIGARRVNIGSSQGDDEIHHIDSMYEAEQYSWKSTADWHDLNNKYIDLWEAEQNNLIKGMQNILDADKFKCLEDNQTKWKAYIESIGNFLRTSVDFSKWGSVTGGYLGEHFLKQARTRALELEQFHTWVSTKFPDID